MSIGRRSSFVLVISFILIGGCAASDQSARRRDIHRPWDDATAASPSRSPARSQSPSPSRNTRVTGAALRPGNRDDARAALLAACWTGDESAVRGRAKELGGHVDDPLGDDGVDALGALAPDLVDAFLIRPSLLTPALVTCLADEDRPAIIDALRAAGADLPNDHFGQARLLEVAARRGHVGVTRSLLAAGCDPNGISTLWGCPVGEADAPVIFFALKHVEVFQALVAAGAKLDVRDSDGDTLNERVAREGTPEVQRAFARGAQQTPGARSTR